MSAEEEKHSTDSLKDHLHTDRVFTMFSSFRVQPLKTHWAGVCSPQRECLLNFSELKLNNSDSSGKSALQVKGRTQMDSQTWCSSTCLCFTFFPFLHPFITSTHVTKEIKRNEKWQPPPPIGIYTNTIILHSRMQPHHAPCSVSKVDLVTLSLEPLLYSKL